MKSLYLNNRQYKTYVSFFIFIKYDSQKRILVIQTQNKIFDFRFLNEKKRPSSDTLVY